MIWPANLVNAALFSTLHSQVYAGIGNRGGLSRERFFTYCFVGSAVWYFFPGFIFEALSVFTWVCWIAPDNVVSINTTFVLEHMIIISNPENQSTIRVLQRDGVRGCHRGHAPVAAYNSNRMSLITFDWSQIAYIGSPLATPWWAGELLSPI